MDLKAAKDIAASEYVFAILFIVGLYIAYRGISKWINDTKQESKERELEVKKLYESHRKESKEREKILMAHLERSNESQERTSDTLDKIQGNLTSLEKKLDEGLNDVWKRIEKLDK